jgi:hypothetical protein
MTSMEPPEPTARRPWSALVVVALIVTLVDVFKPVHNDDPTYILFARHIGEQPLDPYGFSILSFDRPASANHVLAPPLLLYWLAGAIRLFGENPAMWKASLLPFALVFVVTLHSVFRRFAGKAAFPATTLVALSPTFLPSMNLMLDVPSLALSLAGLTVFFSACDRASAMRALAAGLLFGLAIQTKYTGLLAPAVAIAYGMFFQRTALAFGAAVIAGFVAGAWELFLFARQGESHFIYHSLMNPAGRTAMTEMASALAITLIQTGWPLLVFLAMGLVGRRRDAVSGNESKRQSRFLGAWLFIELAGHFVLSPFPAVRRTMGLVVVASLIVARIMASSAMSTAKQWLVGATAVASVVWGTLFAVIDHWDAAAQRNAARMAMAYIRSNDPNAKAWFTGYWGFQFYSEQAGMKQLVPADRRRFDQTPRDWEPVSGINMLEPSRISKGDWIVIPLGVPAQQFVNPPGSVEEVHEVNVETRIPWTLHYFYVGSQPLARFEGPRAKVKIFRATRDFTPVVR